MRKDWLLRLLLAAVLSASGLPVRAQQKALTRHFQASEEHYQVKLSLKAESHGVTTETVLAQTYVTPVVHSAEVTVRWSTTRRVLSVRGDGSAEIEEVVTPAPQECDRGAEPAEESDKELRASLEAFCTFWLRGMSLRYSETTKGLLRETSGHVSELPPLGETAPPLLALWLRRAVRPSVIFPALPFEIGSKGQQAIQPSATRMKNARGSESTEWLDAPGEVPAARLQVVQQLSWIATPEPGAQPETKVPPPDRGETFFADSLTTLSLLDGGVLQASRTASRTITRKVDAVPGLPQAPDFSSKLAISVTIERIP